LLQRYDAFFSRSRLQLVELDSAVVDLATEYRARYGFKTPDALHLASAKVSSADVFLTGDTQLARCDDVCVEVL
jgi:predicted nucleic acid-binding protein